MAKPDDALVNVLSCLHCTVIFSVFLLLQGCSQHAQRATFTPVVVQPGETLSSLASKYLGDSDKGWMIADFNDLQSVAAGQQIIIPHEPFNKGGLSVRGYQTVPVLVYHNFSESQENLMIVRKKRFEQQMSYLKENGYITITVDELFEFLDFKKQLPAKALLITFDDGWKGVYTIAYPILKKYGFKATLFLYTDLINGSRKNLTWENVAELDRNGIDVQCHTKSHRNLNKLKAGETLEEYFNEVQNEIDYSVRIIKEKINKDVKYLAYPYGETNNLVIAYLKQVGFRGAFTVNRDANPFFQDRYSLHRSMIYGDFDLNSFKRNLKLYSSKALQ